MRVRFSEVEEYFTWVLFYLSCIVSLVRGAVVTWSDVTLLLLLRLSL